MSRLLPFKSETTTQPDGARVLPLEDEATDEALAALSSETARKVLSLIYEEPLTPPEIRDEIDTSLQNVHYHLENLEEADLIQPAGSGYSEKGTEMTVYAPASEAVVLFAGQDHDRSRLQTALTRLLGAVGLLAAASYLVRRFGQTSEVAPTGLGGADGDDAEAAGGGDGAGDGDGGGDGGAGGGDGADAMAPEETETPTPEGAADDVGVFGQKTTSEAAEAGDAATPTGEPAATQTPTADAAGTPDPAATETPMMEADTPTPTEAPTSTPAEPEIATENTTAPADTATPDGGAVVDTGTPTAVAENAADAGGGLLADPAITFFLGGLFMLAVVGAWWYLNR